MDPYVTDVGHACIKCNAIPTICDPLQITTRLVLPPYFVNWTLDIFLRFRWALLFQFRWIQYGWLGWIFHTRSEHLVSHFSPEGVPHTFSVHHRWQWRHPFSGFSWDANTFSGNYKLHFQHSSRFSFAQSRLTIDCQIIAKQFHQGMTQLQQKHFISTVNQFFSEIIAFSQWNTGYPSFSSLHVVFVF